ncbi:MAG: hypothetical protein ACKV2T_01820 [Kofleriaceae bacterium]
MATLDVPALDSACATNTTCPDHVDAMNPIYQLALELVATSLAFCGSTYAITVANLLLSNAINTAAPSGNHTEGVRGVAARFTLARPSGGVVLSSARPPPFALRLGFPTSGYRLGITFRGTPSLSRPAMIDPPPGEYFAFAQVLKGELPAQDPVNHYQYAFVFDADGDTSNNYTPLAQYPADFFKDTDRWYELLYTPSAGWTTKVSTARGSSIQVAQSDAQLLVVGSVILLLVPVSEFASSTPAYRFTAFRHTGNYGLQPPHDFDGYVDPPVAMGLHTFEP